MGHRDDIQGLRGVAVLLVVLGHAGVPFLEGGFVGVDVFFVLSGFLITGLLLAQERISLGDFYVRRARRILPAAALTLVVTDLVAQHLLNFVRAREAVSDSIWAALFGANVHFAQVGSDYFSRGQPPSPFLHFWTLSVEEQFYLVWPGILVLALLLGRRHLLAVVAVLGAASLAWSVQDTSASPATAYFSTFARGWELALGAALAVWAPKAAPRARAALGWLGLMAIGCAAVLFSAETPFPGYAALLPALGAVLVIAGDARGLSCAPLRYVGDRSYAYYLWHWPVLVIATEYAGHDLSLAARLLLLAGAFGLSVVSYALVENPVRRMRLPAWRGALLWPAAVAIVLVTAVFALRSLGETAARIDAASAAVRPAALQDGRAVAQLAGASRPLTAVVAAVRAAERGDPIPSPLTPPVGELRGDFYSFPDGCAPSGRMPTTICRLGDTSSGKSIVVFGDSHAQMWMPAILQMATRDHWLVRPLVKLSCVPRSWNGKGACHDWYVWAKRQAAALNPQVALILGSWAGTADPVQAIKPVKQLAAALRHSAASVIVVGDPSSQKRDPVDCLLARGATMKTCTTAQRRVQARTDSAIQGGARRLGAGFIDVRGWLCARGRASGHPQLCPLVVNRTITAVDRGHVSKTYALELAQPFRNAFREELFR
jgi:peptidoglycan/LPS O-acetylase OafA/YrhL